MHSQNVKNHSQLFLNRQSMYIGAAQFVQFEAHRFLFTYVKNFFSSHSGTVTVVKAILLNATALILLVKVDFGKKPCG